MQSQENIISSDTRTDLSIVYKEVVGSVAFLRGKPIYVGDSAHCILTHEVSDEEEMVR